MRCAIALLNEVYSPWDSISKKLASEALLSLCTSVVHDRRPRPSFSRNLLLTVSVAVRSFQNRHSCWLPRGLILCRPSEGIHSSRPRFQWLHQAQKSLLLLSFYLLSLIIFLSSIFSPREGLVDITNDPDFYGIYDEDMNEDPTYEPNSPEEKAIFMKYAENIMLKLTFSTTQVQQHENVFIFETDYWLTNAIKYTQDYLDICTYQRLQQRLYLQKKVIQKHFEKKKEIRKGMGYLKLICFLIPFLLSLKKKMKVPYLNSLLPPFSGKRISKKRPHLCQGVRKLFTK